MRARHSVLAWPAPSPARRPLDRERLVRVSLALLDEVGLEGLTMRRVAEQLGVRSASLYWHVRDKDQLLSLIADAICAEIEAPPASGLWRADLQFLAWAYRRVLRGHRDAATVLATTLPLGPHRLRLADRMLGLLRGAGFSGADAAHAGFLLTDYVTSFVLEEDRGAALASAFEAEGEGDALAAIGRWFEGLPADEYPNMVALAPHLTATDMDARFSFGVRTLLDGLSMQLAAADTD